MEPDQLIGTQETRYLTLETQPDQANDTLTFSFSSEYAANRGWGKEILSHDPSAVDLSYLNSGVACLLWDHDRSNPIGSVERAWLENRRGKCTIKWSSVGDAPLRRSQVEEGTVKGVSCRYEIQDAKPLPQDQGIMVTKWRVLEITLCTIPVDPTVGIGRSQEAPESSESTIAPSYTGIRAMDETELQAKLDQAKQEERDRLEGIRSWGKRLNQEQFAEELLKTDISLEQARAKFLDKVASNPQQPLGGSVNPVGELGLSNKEQKSYSILRAVQALQTGDWSNAGFELECSKEVEKRSNKPTSGFYVPMRDLKVDLNTSQQVRATQSVGLGIMGGNLVQLQLDSANFIDLLRNRMMVQRLGARILSGLVGNLDIPRQTAPGTVYWVPEDGNVTQGDIRFDLLSFRPRTMGALYAITRLMMLQSTPDIEQLVRDDLAMVMALEMDRAALYGSGTAGQPRGVANTTGIGSVVIANPDGGAPAWAKIVELETAISSQNADVGTMGYLTNARMRGRLKTVEKATNTGEFIMPEALGPNYMNQMNGYTTGISNQVLGNRTKGSGTNLCDIFFANWNDLMIAQWGIMEVLLNPYGAGYEAGTVQIRALQTLDVQLRRVQSFALCSDASAP